MDNQKLQESEVIKHLQDKNLLDDKGESSAVASSEKTADIIPLGSVKEKGKLFEKALVEVVIGK